MRYLKVNFFLALFVTFGSLHAQNNGIPKKPAKETSVYDYVNLLSANQAKVLEQDLIRYADSTSTQIVVAIVATTHGDNINYLAAQWANQWEIGQKDKDNGVFILLAKEDRKIAISTGDGVQHLLTDYTSKQIIEYDIIPYFKAGDYYGGLQAGAKTIYQVLQGEYRETRDFNGVDFGYVLGAFLFFVVIVVFLFLIIRGGKGGNKGGGKRNATDSIWDAIILSNMGRGNWSSGSSGGGWSSGGGFSGGFGGGGFSGGGASGSW